MKKLKVTWLTGSWMSGESDAPTQSELLSLTAKFRNGGDVLVFEDTRILLIIPTDRLVSVVRVDAE